MRIHAALMTQNELPDLAANVARLLGACDDVTVVDGGSLDGTIPYMRNWSRDEPRLRFFIHPWKDNFPAQRNNYLRRVGEVASDGDWVVAVDPDEYLDDAALSALRDLARVCESKPERFCRVGFRCRSVSLRGTRRTWEHEDDYLKGLFYRWHGGLCYGHAGEGPVHELLHGADPIYYTGHHPEFPALFYEHRKQEDVVWVRGVRNYFCGGGGMNLGRQNHRWVEMRQIADDLGIYTWHEMQAYLLEGNIDQSLKDWILKYRHETGWDGSSEQREWYKSYFRMFHPEEEPEHMRGERIE